MKYKFKFIQVDKNNVACINSVTVADALGLTHSYIIRLIENLKVGEDFLCLNYSLEFFGPNKPAHIREQYYYEMSNNGFKALPYGYKGKRDVIDDISIEFFHATFTYIEREQQTIEIPREPNPLLFSKFTPRPCLSDEFDRPF